MTNHNIRTLPTLEAASDPGVLQESCSEELESLVQAGIVSNPNSYQVVETHGQLVAVSTEEDTIAWIMSDADIAIGSLSELRSNASNIPGLDVLIKHLDCFFAATEALNQLIEMGIVEEEAFGGKRTFRLTEKGENIDISRGPQQGSGTEQSSLASESASTNSTLQGNSNDK